MRIDQRVAKAHINALRMKQLAIGDCPIQSTGTALGTVDGSKKEERSMRHCGPATVNVTEEVAMRVSAHSTYGGVGMDSTRAQGNSKQQM